MKLKIMIITLLLVGIGSAVNWLPESRMTPGANLSYYDSGSNLQTFDFQTEPPTGGMWVSVSDAWTVVAGKYLNHDIVVGPSSDTFSFLYDYTTDGVDDQVEISAALNSLHASSPAGGTVRLARGTYTTSDYIVFEHAAFKRLEGRGAIINVTGDLGMSIATTQFEIDGIKMFKSDISPSSVGMQISYTKHDSTNVIRHSHIHGFDKQIVFQKEPFGGSTGIVLIDNCVIGGYDEIGRSTGIYSNYSMTVQVTNSWITGYEFAAIHLERCDSFRAVNNVIISVTDAFGGNVSNYGIYTNWVEGDDLVVDFRIHQNSFENMNDSIYVDDTSTRNFIVAITSNEFNGYKRGVVLNQTDSFAIQGNFFHEAVPSGSVGSDAILINNCRTGVISGNTIYRSGGITINSPATVGNFVVSNNAIYWSSSAMNQAIYLNALNSSIIGNSFASPGGITNAITLPSGANYNVVLGNSGTGGKITNSGTGNEVAHNT